MDRKKKDGVSNAIWIPFIWMFLAGSRYVSQWLNLGSPVTSPYVDVYLEGNPVNAASFFILIGAGFIVLLRRRLNWGEIFKNNHWIWLFFLFGAISILWSDYPFVSYKRWIKALGNVIMVLVILTEKRPYEAIGVILRRLAFLMLPISVLFIKYYPDLGRAYHRGMPMFTGVAGQKNGLGAICLISGIYFFWNLLLNRWRGIESGRQLHFSIYLIILPMIAWLLYMANSATSMACMVVAVCLLLISRLPAMALKPRRILGFGIACIAFFGVLELFLDPTATVITLLGRQATLTTRVPMWEELLAMAKNPIVGFGYESFWLGERLHVLQEAYGRIHQAHNGYLEMYLNLGFIGLFFLLGGILSGLRKVSRHLAVDYPTAIFRLCFIVVISLYNWTEATFFGVSEIWVLFLLGVMDIPNNRKKDRMDNV